MTKAIHSLNAALKAHANGNLSEAKYFYQKTLEIDPRNVVALGWLGTIEAQNNNLDIAENLLLRALTQDKNNPDFALNYANVLFEKKHYSDAAVYYLECIRLNSSNSSSLSNLAKCYNEKGCPELGLKYAEQSIKLNPKSSEALINHGDALFKLQLYDKALVSYSTALTFDPVNAEIWRMCGDILVERSNYKDALKFYDEAINLFPKYFEAWGGRSAALIGLKLYDEALINCNQAIEINKNYINAWNYQGICHYELKEFAKALGSYDCALELSSDYPEIWSNRGNAFFELQDFKGALECHDKSIKIKPDFVFGWNNRGLVLYALKDYDESLNSYDKAIELNPNLAEIWSNRGNALNQLKRYEESLLSHEKAIKISANYSEAWINKGNTLADLGRRNEALVCFNYAIELNPECADAWANRGNNWIGLKVFDKAIEDYDRALRINPKAEWILGNKFFYKNRILDWSNFDDGIKSIIEGVTNGKKVIQPFPSLALIDDPLVQQQCAQIYAEDKFPIGHKLGSISNFYSNEKIRIGYFSPDFHRHPVSMLSAEIYEKHDREHFEIIAFSMDNSQNEDEMRVRLKKGFDQFIDVTNLSDLEVAKLSRELKIDIAVNLTGYTDYSRTGIFSLRAAPLQVSWLGYPGTMGVDYIDYIMADEIVIPKSDFNFFNEKIIYLPHCYMTDDSTRVVSERVFTREEMGLPKNGFVYCCFNNDYKFNKQIFDSWARIIASVNDSVIWMSGHGEIFKKNVLKEFGARNISEKRIIFANRVNDIGDHLARCTLADLFLDTLPYNAHSTCIDFLKAGVPVLTRIGKSFASRAASSIINSVGLQELITSTISDYESLAIDLGTNPEKLREIKLKLKKNSS